MAAAFQIAVCPLCWAVALVGSTVGLNIPHTSQVFLHVGCAEMSTSAGANSAAEGIPVNTSNVHWGAVCNPKLTSRKILYATVLLILPMQHRNKCDLC